MKFLFLIAFFILSREVFSQNALDTISIFYPTPTYDTTNDDPNHYYYNNGKRVDKKTGEAGQIAAKQIDKCKPCILKTYGPKGILFEGLQYGDGRIGYWIEYYPNNGKKKLSGQFKEFSAEDCRKYCSMKIGKWQYFNSSGKLIRLETYSNGKLIKSKKI